MTFTEGQLAGSIVTLAVVALLYVSPSLRPLPAPAPTPPLLDRASSSIAVELRGTDAGRRGIYFVEKGTTVADFLAAVGEDVPSGGSPGSFAAPLSPGSSLLVIRPPGGSRQCLVQQMHASKRLALGLPININRATFAELLLVPGIGEKTSGEILALRQARGKIRHLDELMQIRGIKKKRLAKLQKYLYVAPPRRQ